MKIGLVGYQGCGKSTLFTWLTGLAADPSLSHTSQSAMATVPDERMEPMCEVYHPKKVTMAALELVDTPGLSRKHEGNASKLSLIREAGCLVQLIGAFAGADPIADLDSLQEDFLLADLEIVSGRIQRLRESVKKPRPDRDQQIAELAAIEPLGQHLELGKPLTDLELSTEQQKVIKSFSLLTLKPRMAIFNVADDTVGIDPSSVNCPIMVVPVELELELSRMEPVESEELRREMQLESFDRDALIRAIMDTSGQQLFFTAGEKEVRTWMLPKGATAWDAADGIHSDLARGFIRAETMRCEDLIRLGSEREVKAHSLMRQEPKDYMVQDGDVLNIRFSV
jgi:ribosome-binding ATPase YchF (GTP1/OBG family)